MTQRCGASVPPAPPANPAPPAPPVTPPAPPAPPATGDDDPALGEGGKKAIAAERKAAREEKARADALATELETLKAAGLSESEKATKEAVRAAEAAERAKWQTSIRTVRVEAALRVAGATNETLLDLALKSDIIAALKVDDAGKVVDLDKAVEQLKKEIPEMFAPTGPGTVTRGPQTAPGTGATTLDGAIAAHYSSKH